MSADNLTILAVATEWDSKHGGLSTFNRELCTALAQCEGVTVFCGVPALDDAEVERARQVGVRLVAPARVPGITEEQALVRPYVGIDEPVHAVIGHARISGPAALAQLKDRVPKAIYVHFVHMDPEAIEWHKDHEGRDPAATAHERVELERELGLQARLIYAVGPELQGHYANYFHESREVREFVPGLTPCEELARPPTPTSPSCLLFGRADDAELKGVDVAAMVMAELNKLPRHERTRLTILGASPGTAEPLRSRLVASAGSHLQLHVENYTTDRDHVVRKIRSTSLVLMPSLQEGFGLTGLEAISQGTPVLLSRASGLAQALQKYVPDYAAHHIFYAHDAPLAIARRMRGLLDDPGLAFDRIESLRDAMKDRFCWRRSANELIEHLRAAISAPLPEAAPLRRRLPLAERLREYLDKASRGLESWKQTLAATGEWLERPELARLLVHAQAEELPRKPLVLLGPPGSGKSALLSRLLRELRAHEVAVLAIKADFIPATVDSAFELETWLGLPSPVPQALDAVAKLQRTVLVIDQLDALADLVDLKSERLNVLLDLVREVSARGQISIVLSCRTFELEHDARLRSLDCEKVTLEPLTVQEVQRVIGERAPGTVLTERLVELLRLPQTLGHFLSLPPDRRTGTAVESHQGLVRARWEQLIKDANTRAPNDGPDVEVAAKQVAALMADREELWLSTDLPEVRGIGEDLRRLLASGLLVQQPQRGIEHIAFAHQTLFEFGRARAFLDQATLPQYVRDHQNALFVRPVLWATLPYLRAADFARYFQQLHDLWSDELLRRHVHALLLEFLGQLLDPDEKEIALFTERLNDARWQKVALRAILGQQRWFELLCDSCLPGVMTGANGEYAIVLLMRASDFAAEKVAELMERCWWPWPERRAWIERVLRFATAWSPEFVELARRLVTEGSAEPSFLVDKAIEAAPDAAVDLIEIELERQYRALPVPLGPTWSREWVELMQNSKIGKHTLRKAATSRSRMFAERLFPWFATVLNTSGLGEEALDLGGGDSLPRILRDVVSELAASDSAYLATIVGQWQNSTSRAVHLALVAAMQASLPASAPLALAYLLGKPPLLGGVVPREGVFRTDESLYTRQMIFALAPHLNQEEHERLEKLILSGTLHDTTMYDASSKSIFYKANNRHQYSLLSALERNRATTATRRKIEEYTRRFEPPSAAGFPDTSLRKIGSPMTSEQMLAASDDAILGLFRDLPDTTGWRHPRDMLEGGSVQASRALSDAARREPERVAALLPKFQPGVTENPVCFSLDALASQLSFDRFEALIRELVSRGFSTIQFCGAAASACSKALQGRGPEVRLSADLLGMLERWLSQPPEKAMEADEEPDPEKPEDDSSTPVVFSNHDFGSLPRGTWEILDALTIAYLREEPPQVDAWMQVLERHLERADAPKMWRAMTWNLHHVLRAEPLRTERFLSQLFVKYPSVLQTSGGLQLVARAMHYLPLEAAQRWMQDLRAGSWVRRDQAFGELLALLATRRDATPWALESIDNEIAAWQAAPAPDDRLILGLTIGLADLWSEPARRERASELLLRLVPQAGGPIAKAVMTLFSKVEPLLWDDVTRQLLRALAHAPAVLGGGWHDRLVTELDRHLPADAELICEVATALVSKLSSTGQAVYFRDAEALVDIALALQRQPSPLREAGLDLFEHLLELNVSPAEAALQSLDRLKSPPPRTTVVFH